MTAQFARIRRFVRKPYGWALGVMYPDLSQYFSDEDERWYALNVICDNSPKGGQFLWSIAFFCGMSLGAFSPFVVDMCIVDNLRPSGNWFEQALSLVVLPGLGALIGIFSIGWVHGRVHRRRLREFLYNIGKATCPLCGYSLAGHVNFKDMRCPECGHAFDLTTS